MVPFNERYASSLWAEAETHELLVTALNVRACTVCVCIWVHACARAMAFKYPGQRRALCTEELQPNAPLPQ